MKLLVHPVYTHIQLELDKNPDEINILENIQARFTMTLQSYKKQWDYKNKKFKSGGKFQVETVKLIEGQGLKYRFLSGFLEDVFALLLEYGLSEDNGTLDFDFSFNTEYVDFNRLQLQEEQLRDYQLSGLQKALKYSNALIVGCVGSGKTICMAAILSLFREHKALIMVPKKDLMEQLKAEFTRLVPNYKVISKNELTPRIKYNALIDLPVNLSRMSQEELREHTVLLMDEAHGAPAVQAMKTIEMQNAPYRYGFTATPEGRSDGRDKLITGLFGKAIEIAEYKDLVKDSYSPELKIDFHYLGWQDDYVYLEDTLIVFNKRRNKYIFDLVNKHLAENKNPLVLLLCRRLDHVELLSVKYFPQAAVLTGDVTDRDEIIKDIRNGKYQVVIASSIFSQGINIPEFTLGVNVSGGKSSILAEQKSGRMVRGEGVKTWIDIYDCYTNVLERHSLSRLHTYREAYGSERITFNNFPDNYSKHEK